MKRRTLKSLLAATAVAALPLAAQAADTTGVTADTIRIGMFGPLTGPTAVGSLPLLGATAIYRQVNEAGGINGRKLQVVVEDDACDPNKTIAATKKLMSQDQVFMIHGGWCSGTVMAIKPELARHPEFPYMVLGAASTAISNPVQPNIFHPVATTATVAQSMVDFALSKPGAKRIAIISHSDEWGKSHIEPALAELKARGLEPVETAYLERGSTDATSQLLRLRAAKPDAVLAILYPPELTIYLRDANKYGIKAPVIATQGVSLEDMVKRVGNPAATRELYVFYPLSKTLDDPAFQKWKDIYTTAHPKDPVETLSFMGMTGALAIVEALKRAGPDLTREKFMAELNKLRDFDPGIQSGPLSFTPQDHAGIKQGKMIYMKDGKPTIVSAYPAGG
ncbi:ABC transporter substrate-binding protein [Bordetella sp. BOR01]|uniref:ABC transporter substrate-binding protein n=1 Tax=Bordetella sp. BOR01 TaxID=2854779 RepID=UPI001C4491DE|nr:ABC transporter substrate-binding protein [Bordetella sp. BOR01]MBV7486376.1 ABC transporter substrate-binding protein [Bordetella sp. BOR01]